MWSCLTFFVLGRGSQTEDASWWPKHGAWVKGSGYTGIWSPADERWFQRRLEAILTGKEGPLNATAWKNKLQRQKKAGSLWAVVENQAWEFIYREFVQTQASHLPPEMQPKPENSESKELVDVPEEEGLVDAPEEVSADAPEEVSVDAPEEEGSADAPEEEKSADAPEEEKSVDAPEEEGSFDPYSTYVHIAGDLE